MKNQTLKEILHLLYEQRGFDFSGYRTSMLERRVQKRIFHTHTETIEKYHDYLHHNPNEIDHLIDAFTINVSRFFRNGLSFELFLKLIIPDIFNAKAKDSEDSIRIWSAGCSYGEEPYSIAIQMREFLKKESVQIKPLIFATDIDKKALKRAFEGSYSTESIKNVKYGILNSYFHIENDKFIINDEIKKMVQFSFYDMLDKNSSAPPTSIFGGFDIVFCRNVLIYFETDYQKHIFNKLYKSLKPNGYLVLGEAEIPIDEFKYKFKRLNNLCKIYRKIG